MRLQIYTPIKGKEIDLEVESVEVETLNGRIGILNNHIPLITSFKDLSTITCKIANNLEITTFNVKEAFLEIQKNTKETILTVVTKTVMTKGILKT